MRIRFQVMGVNAVTKQEQIANTNPKPPPINHGMIELSITFLADESKCFLVRSIGPISLIYALVFSSTFTARCLSRIGSNGRFGLISGSSFDSVELSSVFVNVSRATAHLSSISALFKYKSLRPPICNSFAPALLNALSVSELNII